MQIVYNSHLRKFMDCLKALLDDPEGRKYLKEEIAKREQLAEPPGT